MAPVGASWAMVGYEPGESKAVADYLAGSADGVADKEKPTDPGETQKRRAAVARELIWALLSSAEFRFNR